MENFVGPIKVIDLRNLPPPPKFILHGQFIWNRHIIPYLVSMIVIIFSPRTIFLPISYEAT